MRASVLARMSLKEDLELIKKPGPHMWRLLFTRLPYQAPTASYHAWHLFAALIPPFAAYMMFKDGDEDMQEFEQTPKIRVNERKQRKANELKELRQRLEKLEQALGTVESEPPPRPPGGAAAPEKAPRGVSAGQLASLVQDAARSALLDVQEEPVHVKQ